MNLLESFKKTTSITPEKAEIYQRLFPLSFSDYIILNTQNQDRNSNYVFWSRIIDLITPILNKNNIKIIQFVENKKFESDHVFIGENVSLNEKAYLIKNAKFFCGSNNLYSLICSENNVKQCFLKHNYNLDNNLASEGEILDGKQKRKGFLNPIGNYINNIRPEEVASKIIKSLFPDEPCEFNNTLYVGKVYAIKSIDLIPNCFFETSKSKFSDEIIVRMDEFFSEENLIKQLECCACSIVTDQAVSPDLLKKYKSRIKKVFFKINEGSNNSILPVLEDLHINFDLMSDLEEEKLNKEKIKYLDYRRINNLNKVDLSFLDEVDRSKVKFKTNKIIIKSGKMYPSRHYISIGKSFSDIRKSFFDAPEQIDDRFREEADSFYFLTSENF